MDGGADRELQVALTGVDALPEADVAFEQPLAPQLIEMVIKFLRRAKVPTELLLGDLVAELYVGRLKYLRERGRFAVWDNRRWRDDSAGDLALADVQRLARLLLRIAAESEDEEKRARAIDWAIFLSKDRTQRAVLRQAATRLAINNADLDRNPFLLNVLNGTIDLRTGELRPHNPADLISKLAPIEYDPNGTCPRFLQFLDEVFIHEEGKTNADLVAYMRRFVGYVLTGETSEEVFLIFWGDGENGKSKFIEVILLILGEYAITADIATFVQKRRDGNAASPDVARFAGARFVASAEPTQGIRLNESFVKIITGRDRIPARFLHQNIFEFLPAFKLALATNHRPEIRGTDHGIWRRVQLVSFLAKFSGESRDTAIVDKLKAELPGILAWAVRGCLEWQRVGLCAPETVMAATNTYREEQSIVQRFFDDVCVRKPGAVVRGPKLHAAYRKWAEDNGEHETLTSRAMFAELRRQFAGTITDGLSGGQVTFRGIGLRDDRGDGPVGENGKHDQVDDEDENRGFSSSRARERKPENSSSSSTSPIFDEVRV
jgi:putative DNA primase/helicase